jgi:hypothetical protein
MGQLLMSELTARKALEDAFQEDDEDIDEGQLFNLEDDDGRFWLLTSASRSHCLRRGRL